MVYSFHITNLTVFDNEFYDTYSPVECYKLQIIGIACIILFILSFISNAGLLYAFSKNKSLRTSSNMFIIALAMLNLVGTIIEFPFSIVNNFYCRWVFKRIGCIIGGFIMYFVGCASIYIMTAVSFERFYTIYDKNVKVKTNLILIGLCLLNGLLWACFPLFGWSYYSIDKAFTCCTVEWRDRSINVISYNVTIFSMVYIIPLIGILSTNIRLVFIVRNLPKMLKDNQTSQDKKRLETERNVTIMIILIILIFIFSWTPYALISMYSAFVDPDGVTAIMEALPSILAKSSMLWTSLIFIFSNKTVKKTLFFFIKYDSPKNKNNVIDSGMTKSFNNVKETTTQKENAQENSKL